MKHLLLLVSITVLFTACKKNTSAGKDVEIYLLKTHQQVAGKCQVDAATTVLQDTPLIRNEGIVIYDKVNYVIELSTSGTLKAQTLKDNDAFAVTVGKQVIYYGYYKPGTSLTLCSESINMGILPAINIMLMSRGGPGSLPGAPFDDQRNNPQLIATLSAQGKLR